MQDEAELDEPEHEARADEGESLARIHDFVRIAKRSDLWYLPASVIAEEGDLVAWTSVSPSQIENYNKCKRLWWFKSIAREPEEQKGNQALGEAVHLICEKSALAPDGEHPIHGREYSREDVKLDAKGWETAEILGRLMVPLLPPPVEGKHILREAKITLETFPGGPIMIGYMDLAMGPGHGWEALLIPNDGSAIVGDYKTTSDFRYMKTPAELADSVQMMTYAKWAITDQGMSPEDDPLPEIPSEPVKRNVYVAHLYARTKPPFGKNSIRNSVAHVTSEQIEAKWQKTLDVVREMSQDAQRSDGQDVEATGVLNEHCSAYGGCAYRDKCGLSQVSPIRNLFSKPKAASPEEIVPMSTATGGSSILAKIQAARAAASGQTAPAPAPEPVKAAPEPVKVDEPKPAPIVEPVKSEPVATTPEPVATPTPSAKPKGPISALVATIAEKHGNGVRPALAGMVGMLYAKENGIPLSPGASLGGMGPLHGITARTIDDLVKLATAETNVPTGIVPADAPPREQSVITKPGDVVVDPLVEGEEGEEGETELPLPGDAATPTGASEIAAQAAQKAKRGRPSAAEVAAREATAKAALEAEIDRRVAEKLSTTPQTDGYLVGIQMQGEIDKARAEMQSAIDTLRKALDDERKALDAARVELRDARLATNSSGPEGFTLYVDCFVTKGKPEGIVDYLDFYAPIAAAVAEANKVDDWRLINYTGKGLLASAFREVVRAEGVPRAMSISSMGPGADVALEVLSPLAKRIVRSRA